MFAGGATTVTNVVWLNALGGAIFGIGLTWWIVGGSYRHDLRAWLSE
jgi:hypothetical protein